MSPGSRTPDRFPPKSRALRVPLRPPSVCRAWVRVAAVCAPERAPLTPLHLLCLGVSADSTRGFAAARVQEGERARRAPGKREEVAPGVRAGPVVSRPGRWELSCGINCLFVSGWEVAPTTTTALWLERKPKSISGRIWELQPEPLDSRTTKPEAHLVHLLLVQMGRLRSSAQQVLVQGSW